MYRRIVLAYDSTLEGRAALREGALVAKRCGARVFLLSVLPASSGVSMAEAAQVGAAERLRDTYASVLEEGLSNLRRLGFMAEGELVRGEPTQEIAKFARAVGADLVVVGHRRRNFLERWWSGASGGYIVDNVDCSLLVAQTTISDTAFEAELRKLDARSFESTG